LGLFKTGHALDAATNVAGWECADILQGKHPTRVDPINGTLIQVGTKGKSNAR